MLELRQIKLPVGHRENDIRRAIDKSLELGRLFGGSIPTYSYVISRKSLDARKKPDLYYIYSVRISFDENEGPTGIEKKIVNNNSGKRGGKKADLDYIEMDRYTVPGINVSGYDKKVITRPVVIGTGPAGLFCAYILAEAGLKPIVFERGQAVEDRTETVEKFWKGEALNPGSNVQFGEGGAGTFSDGKLNTLTKDKFGRQEYVLDTFVEYGANERIRYDSKPHIGTDILVDIVSGMRKHIISRGGEVRFDSTVTELLCDDNRISGVVVNDNEKIDCDYVVLATGHSARDTFEMLLSKGVEMNPKSFAVGFRVTHPQEMINLSQYGYDYPECLEAAPYKLADTAENGRRVYSFCMCPGGYVVNASSENGRICVNGMSYSGRDSQYANSAIIIGVDPCDFHDDDGRPYEGPLAGMYYQRQIEEKAYRLGNGYIPTQSFKDFEQSLDNKDFEMPLASVHSETLMKTQPRTSDAVKGFVCDSDLTSIYFEDMNRAFAESMHAFGRKIKGFDGDEAILYGVEARTSSPVRINRNEYYESNISGVYPCGEGAGYAGGIMSAAVDGIKVAEAVISKYMKEERYV